MTVSTEALEMEIAAANERRRKIEEYAHTFHIEIEESKKKVAVAVEAFKAEQQVNAEISVFKHLLEFMDTLDFMSKTYSKIEGLDKQVFTIRETYQDAINQINSRLDELIKIKSANAELERQVLNKINLELNR